MKAIFIAYNQAYNQEIVELLESLGQRGYTVWEEIGGRGSLDGEPHLGNHAWPTQNHALLTVVEDALAAPSHEHLGTRTGPTPSWGCGLMSFLWKTCYSHARLDRASFL